MGTKTLGLIFACFFFSKRGKQDLFGEHWPECSAWFIGGRLRVGTECGVVFAGRAAVVCLHPPGLGEDVSTPCARVYGIISFKDLHDPVVQ